MKGLIDLAAPANGPADDVFPSFNLYTLDFNDGDVLFPGFVQYATPGGNVDLRAQVSGADVASYSWDTSGIGSVATDISGTSSYDLTFQWNSTFDTVSPTASITLTVTDTDSDQETQTYTFALPQRTSTGVAFGTGTMSWPAALSPDTVLAGDDSFPSQNVSVDANSGALDTAIALPTYNPNVPGLSLTYDSQAAAPQPIFIERHELDPTHAQDVPTRGQRPRPLPSTARPAPPITTTPVASTPATSSSSRSRPTPAVSQPAATPIRWPSATSAARPPPRRSTARPPS